MSRGFGSNAGRTIAEWLTRGKWCARLRGMGEVTSIASKLTVRGRPTDEETREEAFRLWVAYGRSARKVAERLDCSPQTVCNWRDDGQWEQRRQLEAQAFLPGATVEGAIALRIAAHNAAIRLQQITYDNLEHGTPIDDKEVKALTSIAAIGGYSPTGNKSPIDDKAKLNAPVEAPDFSALSLSDLRDLEARAKKK